MVQTRPCSTHYRHIYPANTAKIVPIQRVALIYREVPGSTDLRESEILMAMTILCASNLCGVGTKGLTLL